MEAIVLRLPLTYGPGVKGNFLTLLEAVASQRRLPLAGIGNRRSLLYVGNAVSAIEAALVAPALPGEALADRRRRSRVDLRARHQACARAARSAPPVPCPATFLRGSAALIGRGSEVSRLLDSLEVDAVAFSRADGLVAAELARRGPRGDRRVVAVAAVAVTATTKRPPRPL